MTVVYTPEQNGVAERANRKIIEKAKCMLFDANLEKCYWAEAVNMATFVINRSASKTLNVKTPEEAWSGKKVDVSNLRIFGSTVMTHVPKQKRQKLDKQSIKMVFVGYTEGVKGYRCINPVSKKFVMSRDVFFMENNVKLYNDDRVQAEVQQHDDVQIFSNNTSEENLDEVRNLDQLVQAEVQVLSNADDNHDDVIQEEDNSHVVNNHNDVSSKFDYSNDSYVSADEDEESEKDDPADPSFQIKSNILLPTETVRRSARCRNNVASNFVATANYDEPETVEEAINSHDAQNWKAAMEEEFKSLNDNETWELVQLPLNRNPIKVKWIFKLKKDSEGNIVRHKARLVAKGCSQRFGIDYQETYAPVIRYTSIRLLIAWAVKNEFKIDQMDAITAFLQGDLKDEIYLIQPELFDDKSGRVCKLKKSIYGLKQSGREWNMKLNAKLLLFGFKRSRSDPCIYYNEDGTLVLGVYVDDMLIFWKNQSKCDALKAYLKDNFKVKDLGKATDCVGIHITYLENGISLDQSCYIKQILQRFKMEDCKPVAAPSDHNQKLSISMSPKTQEQMDAMKNIPYQEAVGSLLYLAQGTRPDISFAVNDVSRFNSNFGETHWSAVKRIMRYVKGTMNMKLCYQKSNVDILTGYCDADWASDIDKRRSCTGYLFKLSNAAISWGSKRQPTIALSSTEAEYMALSSATNEVIWLKNLLCELDSNQKNVAVPVYCDNQSAICLANVDGYNARTKHIDVRHHHIRDKIEKGVISLKYIPTEKMTADLLTKAVPGRKTKFCSSEMGLH